MTIKGKLYLAMGLFVAVFIPLFIMIEFTGNFSLNSFSRFEVVSEMRTTTKDLGLKVRGYLLEHNEKNLNEIEEIYNTLIKDGEIIIGMFRSEKSKKMAQDIVSLVKEFKVNIDQRVEIIKRNSDFMTNPSFKYSEDGERFFQLRDEGMQINSNLNNAINALYERFSSRNKSDLAKYVLYSEIVMGVGFVVILLVLFLISRNLISAVNSAKVDVEKIAKNRDLTLKPDTARKDEIGDINRATQSLLTSFSSTLKEAVDTSNENASIAHELSTTSMSVGRSVEKSVAIVSDVTNEAVSINKEISVSVENAKGSKEDIIQANENLGSAKDMVIDLTSKVQNSAEMEAQMAANMNTLSHNAGDVKAILGVISEIAEQTNLLALNATIEAARAGEHGRGFAVVADEVRKLAERTQKSLTEINSTINVIVQSITEASAQMSTNSEDIQNLADVAINVEKSITQTVQLVNTAVAANDRTVQDFIQTGQSVETIVEKIEEVNKISSENARSVEEIASAADHLSGLTEKLNSKLGMFRV